MFKRLETAWNSRTPIWLHNGTKENFIFQFTLIGVFLSVFAVREKVKEYRINRRWDRLAKAARMH